MSGYVVTSWDTSKFMTASLDTFVKVEILRQGSLCTSGNVGIRQGRIYTSENVGIRLKSLCTSGSTGIRQGTSKYIQVYQSTSLEDVERESKTFLHHMKHICMIRHPQNVKKKHPESSRRYRIRHGTTIRTRTHPEATWYHPHPS